MGLLDKAKQAAEQAAAKAKEGVEDVQTKRELSQAYNDLGKSTYELSREFWWKLLPGAAATREPGKRDQRKLLKMVSLGVVDQVRVGSEHLDPLAGKPLAQLCGLSRRALEDPRPACLLEHRQGAERSRDEHGDLRARDIFGGGREGERLPWRRLARASVGGGARREGQAGVAAGQ